MSSDPTGAGSAGADSSSTDPAAAAAAAAADPVGVVYDIQGFSVQDGPGIRTTVFLKGCPLRCPWCHSPESQRFDIQLSWQWRKCIGTEQCGLCLDVCPRGAISPGEVLPSTGAAGAVGVAGAAGAVSAVGAAGAVGVAGRAGTAAAGHAHRPADAGDGTTKAETSPMDGGVRLIRVDWDRCDDCGRCAEQCPAGALSMWGKRYAVSEVVARVIRDRPFFEKSGGGVTISGGEPLSQSAFTLALLEALKAEGVHTALDTTGYAPWAVVESALPHVDLFLLDLKHMDSREHEAAVGVRNDRILENSRKIAAAGGKIQIRIPVIPRFNDSGEDLHALGRFAAELGEAVTIVQLLPYHAMGLPKWERIKHDGPILEAGTPSEKRIGELKAILEEYGLTVQVH
jgi:pyruvate formate lyase activating enzyme